MSFVFFLVFWYIIIMNLITISKKFARNDDLVVMPRGEYESLLSFKKADEYQPTLAQRRSLARAENNLKLGKTFSYDELVKKMGFAN